MSDKTERIGGIFGSFTLKVTPDELKKQSDSVASDVSTISSKFSDISRIMDSSDSFWRGDAASHFRGMYNGYKDDIEEMLLRISEHITDLNQMAGVYETGEKEITESMNSLPADVII